MFKSLLLTLCLLFLVGGSVLISQTADEPNEGVQVEQDAVSGDWQLKWWGKLGRTYFIQHTNDLRSDWSWVPLVESGGDAVREWGFTSTSDRFFLRLAYSDEVTADPEGADFDRDGVSNLDEVIQNTDPLAGVDLDFNGLPDHWELFHGFGSGNPTTAGSDSDADGLTNAEELAGGTDPNLADSDGDGTVDGTDGWPHDPNFHHPRASENYVLIDLSAPLPYPDSQDYDDHYTYDDYYYSTAPSVQIDDRGGVLLAYARQDSHYTTVLQIDPDDGWFAETLSVTATVYYFDGSSLQPYAVPNLNGRFISYEGIHDRYPEYPGGGEAGSGNGTDFSKGHGWHPTLLRSGKIIPSPGSGLGFDDISEAFDDYDPSPFSSSGAGLLFYNQLYDPLTGNSTLLTSAFDTATSSIPDAQFQSYGIGYDAGEYSDGSDIAVSYDYIDYISNDNRIGLYKGSGHYADQHKATINPSGAFLTQKVHPDSDNPDGYLFHPADGSAPVHFETFGALHYFNGMDLAYRYEDGVSSYSLDNGSTFHPFELWDPAAGALVNSPMGKLSDQLVMLAGNNEVILNQQQKPVTDLISNAEGWSNISLTDINSHSAIVGTADYDQAGTPEKRVILLVPFEIDSRDRAVKGSFEIPEGWDQVDLSFRNKDTGQDLGTYENLEPGASTDVHIYDSADDFFSDSEMQQNANGTLPDNVLNQDVVFARDPDNTRKLEFSTVFDELGEIEVVITFGSNQTQAIVTHTLEEDTEMSEFITRMDQRVSSIEVPGGEEILIDEDGDGTPDGDASDILQAFQPGTLTTSGALVGEYHEDDPANLTLLINNDDDNGDSLDDNSDTLVDATDNDIVKFLLKRPVNQPSDSGTLTLSVIGGSSNVRLFTTDGQNELTNYSVDLASPTGDLAGLASGNVSIYVEGLAQANDVTFIWSYTDAGGTPQVSDEVHLNVVDPSLITMMNMFAPANGGLQYAYGNHQSIRTRSYEPNGAVTWTEMALAPVGEALPIENRGMLARIFWDSSFAKLERAFIGGLVDGFWITLKSEKDLVVGVWEFFRDDPMGRTAAIWGAVNDVRKEIAKLPADQIPTLLSTMAHNITSDLYTQAEAALPWEPFDDSLSLDVIAYMWGFTVGSVAESVAVSLVGVGIITKPATVVKGIIASLNAGQYALTVLDDIRKAVAKITHLMLRMAKNQAEAARIGVIGKYLGRTDAPSGIKMVEVIQDAFLDKPQLARRYYEKLAGHWPDVTDEARLAARYQKAQHSLAKTVDLLGDDLTDNGLEGFGLTQKYLFKENVDELDRADDLIKSFGDLDTPAKRQAFNETMEQAKTTLDAGDLPASGLKVSTQISDVYSEVYHYTDDGILTFLQQQGSSWYLPPKGGNLPTYLTTKKFNSAAGINDELQKVGNNRYRVEYTTSDISSDLDIPIAQKLDSNGSANGVWSHVEPLIKDNDHLGVGGPPQFTTRSGATVQVFDLLNNTYVNP